MENPFWKWIKSSHICQYRTFWLSAGQRWQYDVGHVQPPIILPSDSLPHLWLSDIEFTPNFKHLGPLQHCQSISKVIPCCWTLHTDQSPLKELKSYTSLLLAYSLNKISTTACPGGHHGWKPCTSLDGFAVITCWFFNVLHHAVMGNIRCIFSDAWADFCSNFNSPKCERNISLGTTADGMAVFSSWLPSVGYLTCFSWKKEKLFTSMYTVCKICIVIIKSSTLQVLCNPLKCNN